MPGNVLPAGCLADTWSYKKQKERQFNGQTVQGHTQYGHDSRILEIVVRSLFLGQALGVEISESGANYCNYHHCPIAFRRSRWWSGK